MGIELTLMRGAQDGREDLLGLRPTRGPIPTADLARDDRRPERVFGAPVGGIDRGRIEEKREERRPLDREVRRKPPHVGEGPGMIEESIEALEQAAARDRQSVWRHLTVPIPIAQRQGLLQGVSDGKDEADARVISVKLARPPQQVRQTRLMERAGEAAIRRPAIAHDDARKAPAKQPHRFRIAAAGLDPIDRRVRRGYRPQPVQRPATFHPVSSGVTTGLPRTRWQSAV